MKHKNVSSFKFQVSSNMEKKKILFIEDEMRLQNTMKSVLESAGYDVSVAFDGEVGIKAMEDKKPDLVLLDLILPKKDGYDVLEFMKSKVELASVPVIVLTNLEEKFDIEKTMSYNVCAYLVKTNYTPKEIAGKIREVLKS